jgi:hypothetical protein
LPSLHWSQCLRAQAIHSANDSGICMNDIRSALAAAMHSRDDMANKHAKPVKSAKDRQIEMKRVPPRQDTPGKDGRRSETCHQESEPLNWDGPRDWKASDKDAFKALPQSAQDFILRRWREIETEFGEKRERLDAFHREYEPVAKMLEPFAGRLSELNLTPRSVIQHYIDIERRLAAGDGVPVIKALVDGYKIAPEQVIEALGSKWSHTQHVPLSYPAQINRYPPTNVAQHAATLRNFESELEQFKTAQDAAGNRLYPHYADVEPDMAAMALGHSSRGQTIPPLKELYERAVWTNPALRKALISAQQGSNTTTADVESRPRIAARRPASTSSTDESKRVLTRQSSRRSLRDEILAHTGGA